MASTSSSVGPSQAYLNRRRGSLPAMKLQVPMTTNHASPRESPVSSPGRSRHAIQEDSSQRGRTGSWSESDRRLKTKPKSATGHLLKPGCNSHHTPRIKSHGRDMSPRIATKHDSGSDDDDDDDSDPPPVIPAKYHGRRRHSVDVLMTSQQADDISQTQKAWAQFCRVSDPNNFDAGEYEKDDLPSGSSIFQSVLGKLQEEDEPTPANQSKATNRRKPKTKSKSPSYVDNGKTSPGKRRQVRFKGDGSDSDS